MLYFDKDNAVQANIVRREVLYFEYKIIIMQRSFVLSFCPQHSSILLPVTINFGISVQTAGKKVFV